MNPVWLQLIIGILAFGSLVMAARSGLAKSARESVGHGAKRASGVRVGKRLPQVAG